MMTPTPRMRRALDRIEAKRIELERAIVADLERRFFTAAEPDIRESVIHLGLAAVDPSDTPSTATGCQFSITWFE